MSDTDDAERLGAAGGQLPAHGTTVEIAQA